MVKKRNITKKLNFFRSLISLGILWATYLSINFMEPTDLSKFEDFFLKALFGQLVLLVVLTIPDFVKIKTLKASTYKASRLDDIFFLMWKEDQVSDFKTELVQLFFMLVLGTMFGFLTTGFYVTIGLGLVNFAWMTIILNHAKDWKKTFTLPTAGFGFSQVDELTKLVLEFASQHPEYQERILRDIIMDIYSDLTSGRGVSSYEAELLPYITAGVVEESGMTFEKNVEFFLRISQTSDSARNQAIYDLLIVYSALGLHH